MNLLAHLYLADMTGTSPAGQLLGDMVKGPLQGHYSAYIENGIRLHRNIDSFTDRHPVTEALRRRFEPPFRRYAGILTDIGFDYCLASNWAAYNDSELPDFAQHILGCVHREWPPCAPLPKQQLAGLERVIINYRQTHGLETALHSIARRLRHDNPLPRALPVLLDELEAMADGFDVFFPQLCGHVKDRASAAQ